MNNDIRQTFRNKWCVCTTPQIENNLIVKTSYKQGYLTVHGYIWTDSTAINMIEHIFPICKCENACFLVRGIQCEHDFFYFLRWTNWCVLYNLWEIWSLKLKANNNRERERHFKLDLRAQNVNKWLKRCVVLTISITNGGHYRTPTCSDIVFKLKMQNKITRETRTGIWTSWGKQLVVCQQCIFIYLFLICIFLFFDWK